MAQPKQKSGYKVSVNADDYDEVMKRCSELSRKLLTEHPIYAVLERENGLDIIQLLKRNYIGNMKIINYKLKAKRLSKT